MITFREFCKRLSEVYGEREAKAMARLVYERRFGLSFTDVCMGKDTQLSANDHIAAEEIADRLCSREPVQYVLGEAWFDGMWLKVRPGVLIPRPETAELCQWVAEEWNSHPAGNGAGPYRLLDCCTGSGCIALDLKRLMPMFDVDAYDLSEKALAVARENIALTGFQVNLYRDDAVRPECLGGCYDLIISNPPYVCTGEREEMEPHVLEHEPEMALFVPDDNPLLYYRAIARQAWESLRHGGRLYFEINPRFSEDMHSMLLACGFVNILTKADMQGYLRMMRAERP